MWILGRRPWLAENWLGASLALTALLLLFLALGEFGSYAPYAETGLAYLTLRPGDAGG